MSADRAHTATRVPREELTRRVHEQTGIVAPRHAHRSGRHWGRRERRALDWARGGGLWSLPRRAIAIMVGVELAALGLSIAAGLIGAAPTVESGWRFGLLAVLGVVFAQITGRVELLRRYPVADRQPIADVSTIWVLPAALALPPALAALLNVVLLAHLLTRPNRRSPMPPYRLILIGAAGLLATLTCSWLSSVTGARASLGGATWTVMTGAGLALSVLGFAAVNALVVVAGFCAVTRPERFSQLLLSRDYAWFEAATVVLGLFVAVSLARTPWIVPSVMVIGLIAQRATLVGQLQTEADTDGKTGLLTPAAWQRSAQQDLDRAAQAAVPAAVMMIDLDHFKDFNSTHGHLVGDVALRTVGQCLRAELRGYDAIGRYGGEEFAIVLPNTDSTLAEGIATRLRLRIADAYPAGVAVTASIGVAHFPRHGLDLVTLLEAADVALFQAKDAGRNRVVIAAIPQ